MDWISTTVVQKDTRNTAIAVSGDRVLALVEKSPPSEIEISKDGRLCTFANMCRLDGAVVDAPITGGSIGAHGRTNPKTGERIHVSYSMAKLGYRCISVRHSGGFFQIPPLPWIFLLLPLVAIVIAGGSNWSWGHVNIAIIGIIVLWTFLQWQAQGAAHLDDMVQDVTEALHYIRHDLKQDKIILGGYSSGGHVVATWLSRQTEPLEWIQGVLYVSAVLSLDAPLMHAVTLSVFGQWAHSIPSTYTNNNKTVGVVTLSPPPSNLPHLVIGCRHETFGIPILDATFCAQAYVKQLQEQAPAKCVLVDSNHWFILNSYALSSALQQHLPWLLTTASVKNETNHNVYHHPTMQPRLASTASSSTSISSEDLDGLRSSGDRK